METNNEKSINPQSEKEQLLDEMTAKYIYGGGPTPGPIGPIGPIGPGPIICFSTCIILCGIICMPACSFIPGRGVDVGVQF